MNLHSHTYTIYGNEKRRIKKIFFFFYANVSDQFVEYSLVCMFHTQCHAEVDLHCSGPGLETFLTSQSLGLGHDLVAVSLIMTTTLQILFLQKSK